MALMTLENAQVIVTEAAGKPVVVKSVAINEAGPSITAMLDNDEEWTIAPGPGWELTVTGPDQKSHLVEFRDEAESPSP
jgi:hypothetical protein